MDPTDTNRTADGSSLRMGRRDVVIRAMEEYLSGCQPGDRIPTHTHLMRIFHASERIVHGALDELRRQGRIIPKNGVGTFVADHPRADAGTMPLTLVVVARPDHSFFDRFLDLLYQHAEAVNLKLICLPLKSDDFQDLNLVDSNAVLARTFKPIGYLLFGYHFAPLAEKLQAGGSRVALVGVPPIGVTAGVPNIYNDHEYGGYLTTQHLISLGHRRIAYAQSGAPPLTSNRRWIGHKRAIWEARKRGLTIDISVLSTAETQTWEGEPQRCAELIRGPQGPTAIAAWNDYEAVRIQSQLTRAGIDVPAEVSLTGYDNLPAGQLFHPGLTTVDHGMRQQLHYAVDLLTREVGAALSHTTHTTDRTHTMVFMPTLVPRESTREIYVERSLMNKV